MLEDLNLWECVVYTGDIKCASMLFESMIDLYKSEKGIPEMTKKDHSKLARIMIRNLRNSLHIACALGHAEMLDFIIQICSRNRRKGGLLLEEEADEESVHIYNFKKTIIKKVRHCWKHLPINFAILHNKGNVLSKLASKVRVVESEGRSIRIWKAKDNWTMQDEEFVIKVSVQELARWILYSSVFGANEVMMVLVEFFSSENRLINELDEGKVFLWGFIHGQVMIRFLEQFEGYAKEWCPRFQFLLTEKANVREWFDNRDLENSFDYFIEELSKLFRGNKMVLKFDRIRQLCFIAYLFHKGGISSFPFEKHQLIFPDEDNKRFLHEMNWLPSLHLRGSTDLTIGERSLEICNKNYLKQIVNFLSIEAHDTHSLYDLVAKDAGLQTSFPLPFVSFILAYMLKSSILNFALVFERYPSKRVIEFTKLKRFTRVLNEHLRIIKQRSFGINLLLIDYVSIMSAIWSLFKPNTQRILCDNKEFQDFVEEAQKLTISARKALLNVSSVAVTSLQVSFPRGAPRWEWEGFDWRFKASDVLEEVHDFSHHIEAHYQRKMGPQLLIEILEKFIVPYFSASSPIRLANMEQAFGCSADTWHCLFAKSLNVDATWFDAACYFFQEISLNFLKNADKTTARYTVFSLSKLLSNPPKDSASISILKKIVMCNMPNESYTFRREQLKKWLFFMLVVHKKLSKQSLRRKSCLRLIDAANATIWVALLSERNQTIPEYSFEKLVKCLPIAPLIKQKMLEAFLG